MFDDDNDNHDENGGNAETVLKRLEEDLVEGVTLLVEDLGGIESFMDEDYDDEGYDGLVVEEILREDDGDGNEMRSVRAFTLNGRFLGYVRFTGTYSSWGNSEWHDDEYVLVEQRKVVMTKFIAVDGSESDQYDEVLDHDA